MPTKFEAKLQAMENYGERVIAPILVDYVEWVLENADIRGFKRLYFLARDGHVLQKLAESICNQRGLSIECRYLYCSRYALRTASYGLLSKEEVLSLVGMTCVQCTPYLLLERCHFSQEQIMQVSRACGYENLDVALNEVDRLVFVERLKDCALFWKYLQGESQNSYDKAIAYFKQEGLFTGDVAVVDSGWSGSMQRSLGQLLHSMGFSYRLEGFYFGMYQSPKDPEDGIYHTFYFNSKGKLFDKAWFNNNLFECMLAAPHGMTVGYQEQVGRMEPVLREKRDKHELTLVEAQEAGILRYAEIYLLGTPEPLFHEERLNRCRKRLQRCMVHPTVDEVELLGHFQFCDDATEGYFLPLVRAEGIKVLNTRLLPVRFLRKLTRGRLFAYHPFVWYYGAVVGAPKWIQPLYRWNDFLWECVRLSR